jgi:hypothetical protein
MAGVNAYLGFIRWLPPYYLGSKSGVAGCSEGNYTTLIGKKSNIIIITYGDEQSSAGRDPENASL